MFDEVYESAGHYLRSVFTELDKEKYRAKKNKQLDFDVDKALEEMCIDIDLEGKIFGED